MKNKQIESKNHVRFSTPQGCKQCKKCIHFPIYRLDCPSLRVNSIFYVGLPYLALKTFSISPLYMSERLIRRTQSGNLAKVLTRFWQISFCALKSTPRLQKEARFSIVETTLNEIPVEKIFVILKITVKDKQYWHLPKTVVLKL